jgi:Putative Actinobacterial Holin-X, holin superfamily III
MTNTIHPNELRAQPVRNLLPRLFREVSTLIRQERDLVRAELTEKAHAATATARLFSFYATSAAMTVLLLTACVVVALSATMALWLALLIVGCVYAVVAVAFGMAMRAEVKRSGGLLPTRTARQLLAGESAEPLSYAELDIDATRNRIDATIGALGGKSDLAGPMRDIVMALGGLGVAVSSLARTENSRN